MKDENTSVSLRYPKLADAIVDQLQQMIAEGCWGPGERLPSERELAVTFDVSRPSIREAIRILEVKGLVDRKQGEGTFVRAAVWQELSNPLFELINSYDESELDLLEFRHALEGICAFYAATRRTEADIAEISDKLANIEHQHQTNVSIDEETQAVLDFTLKLVEASHNVVFLQVVKCWLPLLQQNVHNNFIQLQGHNDIKLNITEKRRQLLEAIQARQPEQARQISHEHLAIIEAALFKHKQQTSRIDRALRRQSVGIRQQ